MKHFGCWRRKCGYIVYINKDGYITKYFNEDDEKARVKTLDVPCHLEAFRQRLLRNGDLKIIGSGRRKKVSETEMEVM